MAGAICQWTITLRAVASASLTGSGMTEARRPIRIAWLCRTRRSSRTFFPCVSGQRVGNHDHDGEAIGMTKRQTALAGAFLVVGGVVGLFWLARLGDDRATTAVAPPLADSLTTRALGNPPVDDAQDASGSVSPLSTFPPGTSGEPSGRQQGGRDRVAGGGGTVSPASGTASDLPPDSARPGAENGALAWWDDVQRWRYVDVARPDLRERDLGDAELGFVDLANADLRHANMEGADLNRANLAGANLQGAIVKRTYLYGTVLREAVLRGTEIGPANISAADLRGADLRDVRIMCRDCSTQSLLMSSNFNGANLRGAHLGSSNIHRSAFEKADLRGANFTETEGVPKSLRGALYNRHTQLPERINPEEWEMVYVPDDDSAP